MKKLFSLSLMMVGLAGSVFAVPSATSHRTDINTGTKKQSVNIEKNQQEAWAPLPEMGNPHKPCLKVAWAPLPEMGNPHKPC